ncbi:MAG: CotH kinase family protein [Clostridia bacterium]|nr:CotH kinase family protein [Clostridia bacterium]
MLAITILFMCGERIGIQVMSKTVKYERTLFDTSYVHKIDIVMDDWDSFIETCENEEYAACTVVVDGEKHANIAIRAKGNTSLSSVKAYGTNRYSFKLEFDRYETGKTLDGLDKLCLNNLIQDNTMMKDYIVYQLMNDFGADSPLCSFAYLTVNGEDWGLYLAVEGVEDSFLSRNYGSETGELYKPDSMSFGGGRGNGKGFNFDDFDFDSAESEDPGSGSGAEAATGGASDDTGRPQTGDDRQSGFPSGGQFPNMPEFDGSQGGFPADGQFPDMSGFEGGFPSDGQFPDTSGFEGGQGGFPSDGQFPGMPGSDGGQSGFPSGDQFPGTSGSDEVEGMDGSRKAAGKMQNFFGGMGSDDVKLKYIDDDPDSYPNVFDNAKTDVSKADQKRLISSLKSLSSYTDLENVLDTDEVLRYFVVHNFVCNGDSYTGSMIHNYYLHESDGKLGMIPWDYNLAFGTFQGGNASGSVNASIDSPVSGSLDDRPMVGWIFSDESYTAQYHELFSEFLEKWFTNGELETLIEDTAEMIRPYVEKDPTKFCATEEFENGVSALSQFVSLRAQAVRSQLAGDGTAVDTGDLNLSDMGSMGGGRSIPGMSGGDSGKAPLSEGGGGEADGGVATARTAFPSTVSSRGLPVLTASRFRFIRCGGRRRPPGRLPLRRPVPGYAGFRHKGSLLLRWRRQRS